MGFKRTSEGRVYFHTPEDGANDAKTTSPKSSNNNGDASFEKAFQPPPFASGPAAQSSPQTQIQIIALLKALNERLKSTQNERNEMAKALEEYRTIVGDLQKKADVNEKAYKTLEQKLSKGGVSGDSSHAEILARDALQELEETRMLLANIQSKADRADAGVTALKKLQVEQAEKIAVSVNHAAVLTKRVKDTEAQQEKINEKVTDTLAHQSRLSRKVEKAMEERTRFLRKLERIEETVLQTRDSLNAKAMVLLTDQGVAAQKGLSAADMQAAEQAPQIRDVRDAEANEKLALRLKQTAAAAAVVVLGLAGVWSFSTYMNARQSETVATAPVNTTSVNEQSTTTGSSSFATPAENMEWSIEQDSSRFAAPEEVTQNTVAIKVDEAADDIGALDLNDQQAVEAALAENPQQVAALMNQIEPGSTDTGMPENVVPPRAQAEQDNPVQADETPVETASVDTTAPTQTTTKPAPARTATIKPDSKLPEQIKAIEEQAFEGVPEAQHDLAAIYTAGHGGVSQDYNRAAYWFEQAAANGVANAAYNLGVLNHQGLGIDQNLDKAIGWYSRAAELGHPEAQYNLGIAYIEGIGVPYDATKAATYFENAANNNIMEAAYNLGLIYENGLLGEAQPDKALSWYKKAADQGSPEAAQALRQLARSLDISLDQVNAVAEDITPSKPAASSVQDVAPAAVGVTQATTAQVQEYLMKVGLYPGPADGVSGPLTRDAIRSYQRKHNLEADGAASKALLSHMLANDS